MPGPRNGRLSYTDPKISLKEPKFLKFSNIIEKAKNHKITVVMDWLSILFTHPLDTIPEPQTEVEKFTFEAGGLAFEYSGKGTQHYKYIWNVHKGGELVAKLLSHTRNDKFVRKGTCKIDFQNHLFYSTALWPIYDLLISALTLNYKNISRVDIAIDNANYLMEFCNTYVKQSRHNKAVEFKGRPRINSKVLDKPSMLYQNFFIGSPGSGKVITIYNKSLDIVNTRKEYIQKFWQANGIMETLLDIDMIRKRLKATAEPVYLEGYKNIFRFEIRIKGQAISEIKNFNLGMLKTTDNLMSIVKLLTRRFFDATFLDNKNIARCTPIQLLPFHKFNLTPLEKIELKERTDLYKTKLSINKNIKQLYTGKLDPENASVMDMLLFDIQNYDLQKWFDKKHTDEWQKTYSKMNPNKAHVSNVEQFIEAIKDQLVFEPTDI